MKSPKIAVLQFPGSNCEYETVRAAQRQGLQADIIRWNVDPRVLSDYQGFVLPGGFSYQDRVRSGVIASKLPIIDCIVEAAQKGLPVLGICNGCQILAETGLVPDTDSQQSIEVALSPNTQNDKPHGFVCDWVFIKISKPQNNIFTRSFKEGDVLPIAINHGDGNFRLKPECSIESLSTFFYCDESGNVSSHSNPNGTFQNIAGLSNKAGNVLAMMPHPERAVDLKQIPDWISPSWAKEKEQAFNQNLRLNGPWAPLFESMKVYIEETALVS